MSLLNYTLHLADNALILGHRNSEWCGHGPVLEQDIAITNISLDLIGQARNFYQYAALIKDDGSTEDTFAYTRDVRQFLNCLLVEQPNGDWAKTILRQFFFSNYQFFLYEQLQKSSDTQLAAIAAKAIKEVTYHLRWSSEWVIRLGDGTEESNRRINEAIDESWNYTGEMFLPASYESEFIAADKTIDPALIKNLWQERTAAVFNEAGLTVPASGYMHTGGKEGKHSEYMGFILAELQFMQRAYPDANW